MHMGNSPETQQNIDAAARNTGSWWEICPTGFAKSICVLFKHSDLKDPHGNVIYLTPQAWGVQI